MLGGACLEHLPKPLKCPECRRPIDSGFAVSNYVNAKISRLTIKCPKYKVYDHVGTLDK
jgi:phage FluMu protein Com